MQVTYTTYIRTPTSRTERANQTGFCAVRARNQAAFLCGRHIKLLCQFMDSVAKRIIEHEPVSYTISLSVEAEAPQYGPNFSRFKSCRFATPHQNRDGVCGNVSHVNHIRLVLPPMTAGEDGLDHYAAQIEPAIRTLLLMLDLEYGAHPGLEFWRIHDACRQQTEILLKISNEFGKLDREEAGYDQTGLA